jgi:hypothetical protein
VHTKWKFWEVGSPSLPSRSLEYPCSPHVSTCVQTQPPPPFNLPCIFCMFAHHPQTLNAGRERGGQILIATRLVIYKTSHSLVAGREPRSTRPQCPVPKYMRMEGVARPKCKARQGMRMPNSLFSPLLLLLPLVIPRNRIVAYHHLMMH